MEKQIYLNSIDWDKAYSVGHERIDNEHKRIFELTAEVQKYKNDIEKIKKIIKELILYTKTHFFNEENYMKSINYDLYEEHKNEHKRLNKEFTSIVKDINNESIEDIAFKINKFIYTKILQHILLDDKQFHHFRKTREELKHSLKWIANYKVNDKLIDSEHKELFEIATDALNYDNTDIKQHIKTTLSKLYKYMQTHFEHEENFMENIEYPLLEEHKILHQKIIDQMNDFIKTLTKMKIIDFEKKLLEYMDIWLISHILFEDRKIIYYLKTK
jgi:hemerythrin